MNDYTPRPLPVVFLKAIALVWGGWNASGPCLANGERIPTCDLSAARMHSATSALEMAAGHQLGAGDPAWDHWDSTLCVPEDELPDDWEREQGRTHRQVISALALGLSTSQKAEVSS